MDGRQEDIKFCGKDGLIMLLAYTYMSSLIYGIILMKDVVWARKNYIIAIIIYLAIIVFDFILWYISIKFRLCVRVRNRIENTNEWFQELNINEIRSTIQRHFQVIELVNSDDINDSNKSELDNLKKCLICSKEYERLDNNIKFIKLTCEHEFCEECISKWCNKKNTCPLCRSEILNETHIEV